jgi:hypothetical protein
MKKDPAMKKVLLTNPCGPYDTAWGEDMLDLLNARLARGHDGITLKSELRTWGLYLIAENLRNPCTVLEHPSWDDFLKELAKGYDVVGIQLKSVNTERCVRMMEAIRKHSPGTEIVVGGYGVGALDDPLPGDVHGHAQFIKDNADHLCREEGVRFMRRLLGDTPVERPITQYLLPHARFQAQGTDVFTLSIPNILVALGCPGACEFCNTSAFFKHRKIYVAEPEQVYDFMRYHMRRVGMEMLNVTLYDEDMFRNPAYVRELGRLIRSDRKTWGIRWITFGSVSGISAFDPEELRECGLGGVWIGVESGLTEDERSKTGYAKREGRKTPPKIFEELHRCGIHTIGSMILGFDFHTPENIEWDIDYFVNLKPTFYQIAPLTPCPGTKLYREILKAGRLYKHYNYSDLHIWKDDVFQLKNFRPGEMRKYYNLAHEKLRTVNGPPALQFCEMNISAYETLKNSKSEFLRYQAETSRTLALGALPIVRAIAKHPPSPLVRQRAKEMDARARRVCGTASLPMRAIGRVAESIFGRKIALADPLDKQLPVSNPPVHKAYYNHRGWRRSGRRGKTYSLRPLAPSGRPA